MLHSMNRWMILLIKRKLPVNKITTVHQALWWIPEGHIPSVEEGKEKLNHLLEHGSSETAFTFAKPYGFS
jgi:hypothetical protein